MKFKKNLILIQSVVRRYLQMKLLSKCKRARERIFLAVHSYHLRYKLMEWTIEIHSAASEGDVEFLTSLTRRTLTIKSLCSAIGVPVK